MILHYVHNTLEQFTLTINYNNDNIFDRTHRTRKRFSRGKNSPAFVSSFSDNFIFICKLSLVFGAHCSILKIFKFKM